MTNRKTTHEVKKTGICPYCFMQWNQHKDEECADRMRIYPFFVIVTQTGGYSYSLN